DPGRDGLAVADRDAAADEGVDVLGLPGRSGLAGADGPDRLVGHHRPGRLVRRELAKRALELALHDLEGPVRLALGEGLAHAGDGDEAMVEGGPGLPAH